MKREIEILFFLAAALGVAHADTILNSKHDLSARGPGSVKATTESEVCIFCHTPHMAVAQTPLWNRELSTASYTPYSSSTSKARIGQPTGASKLCLSCHDGTVALGMVKSRHQPVEMQRGITVMPQGRANFRTDLSDDHPISLTYDNALASQNGELKTPAALALAGKARLDHDSQLQCTSCHDPHDNRYGQFLVMDNTGSALCTTCHDQRYWSSSIHRTSAARWNGAGVNPWPHTAEKSVSANGCENCHAPHGAGRKDQLLTFASEEETCYACHSGNVAARNIQADFNLASVHPIERTGRLHDPLESAIDSPRHATCSDCHNPHAARSTAPSAGKDTAAAAPRAAGRPAGVRGVNAAGAVVSAVSYEYELCYRCHADSGKRGAASVTRQHVQTNTRLAFAANSASYHPVQAVGKNHNVPSLLAPWTTASRMSCSDCHANSEGAGGAGRRAVHGSQYAPLLANRLDTTDFNQESPAAYALCYSCHSRGSLLDDQSFSEHHAHVSDVKAACTTCHDSHGASGTPHLINFNTTYVTRSSGGLLEFIDTGVFSGTCYLTCHGKDHNPLSYGTGKVK